MTRFHHWLIVLWLPFVTAVLADQGTAPPGIPSLGERMEAFVKSGEVAGVVALVADETRTLHLSCHGMADIATARPMDPDTLFWIASMTKPLTATAVMMLHEEGRLSVDDPVANLLMIQRAGLPNSDGSDLRKALHQAAAPKK